MRRELSLYIHIPFCASKCDYCDFYSVGIGKFSRGERGDAETRRIFKEFLAAIISDIYEQVERFYIDRIPTVYIGGGTPSVLGEDIKILFNALKKLPSFAPEEFTIEANPESLAENFLEICKEGGANRLSLGIQTFYGPSRFSVNRAGVCSGGDPASLEKALALAKKYFPKNLSCDLITGFPHQTKKIVLDGIKRLLDFDPAHISVYSLTLEKGTPLEKKIRAKELFLPDKDTADGLWFAARDALINAGYKHYEVSNFAKKGFECRHNIRYWRMEGWLGSGPSASGTVIDEETMDAKRYTYAADVETYLSGMIKSEQLAVSSEQLIREIIMMGYRYCDGPDPKWKIEKHIPNTLEKWKDKDKMLFLNSFLIDAFKELDK